MTRAARVRRACELCAPAAALWCALASPAHAHEAPAEPPDFLPGDCIWIVDKAEQEPLHIEYALAYDDVQLGLGDIPLPDAKTHQFFAFRGSLIPRGFGYELYPFDPAIDAASELPLWITIEDVKRAAQASGTLDGTQFSGETLPPGGVLTDNPAFEGRWLRITADDARVPITIAQSDRGAYWQLADVEPGLYSVAAYVFSPPYNGWAARHGLVKIVDGGQQLGPAAVIEPVHSFLYTGHGRRVRACIDAPAGSKLRSSFRVEERPEGGFTDWLQEREVETGTVELCFHHPRPDLVGSLRLRFELEAPDGSAIAVYSPDTITVLHGESECVPSDTICCDAAGAPAADAGAPEASDAGAAPEDAAAAAEAGEGAAGSPAGDAGSVEQDEGDDGGGGCAAARVRVRAVPGAALIAAVLLWVGRRRRR